MGRGEATEPPAYRTSGVCSAYALPHDLGIARTVRAASVFLLVASTMWGLVAASRRVEDDAFPSAQPA